jgi:hypothetical protein
VDSFGVDIYSAAQGDIAGNQQALKKKLLAQY